jgi:two-component system OmpR family sensor kinase
VRRLRRLPLRWRVTATFTLAAALVLAVLGVFLHVRLVHQLDNQIAGALEQRRQDVSALLGSNPEQGFAQLEQQGAGGPAGRRDTTQLLSSAGKVLASEGAPDESLLTGAQITLARRGESRVITVEGGGPGQRIALLAGPVSGGGVVVVGASLDQHDGAVRELDRLLFVGLPAALLLAALAGLWGSRVALAPVDRMRERAEFVGFANPEERLPEPEADDELRRLARTLNRMLDRLQDGYARERSFVDDAAHELRTPLTMLRGELELELAGTRARSPAELEATVQSARRQTERLVALANDLLILARSADGQLPLRRERLDVQTTLDAAALRAGARAGDRPIVVEPAEGRIDVDRLRIEQALDNLIANALEHGDGRVLIGAIREPEALRLTVDDEGAGVDPAVAQRAFDRFARGDAARAGSGTGLGLAIVRTIAAAHGGTAGLEPRPGGGTRAWLCLPG